LNRRLNGLLLVAAMAIVLPSCGEANPGVFPEPKYPGASRDGIERPLGKGAKAEKPLTAKTKAAIERAKAADPRGR
jgi:hypothetical protein